MKFQVVLCRTEAGYSVSVPALPGCRAHGATEQAALAAIADAIREQLALPAADGADVREIEVAPEPDSILPPAPTLPPGTTTELASDEPGRRSREGSLPRLAGLEIVRELGRGGMGVVYEARQMGLNRAVAVKVVLGTAAGPAERARFRAEALATARLQHPNIVQIHEVGEHDGCPYFVLELCSGGSLADRLDGTPLPIRQAAELVRTLALAVQHAHERGVLHRDLKPGNVLLAADGTPKIADFGLARLDDAPGRTRTGAVMGSPCYMAPEQAEGRVHDLSPATDVYALGAILYELLTGRPPFKAPTVLETLEQVRTLDPVAPATLRPGLDPDLETICRKCLEKEPKNRYASAQAMADDLSRYLAGEPIRARPPTLLDWLARSLGYRGAALPAFRSYGLYLLLLAPVPALIQIVVFLLWADRPAYPVICMVAGYVGMAVLSPILLWCMAEPLRQVARGTRRYLWSVALAHQAGYLVLPILLVLMRPGHDLGEFYLIFPLCILLEGNKFLMFASEAGVYYPIALFYYVAAVLFALVPWVAPVATGVLVGGSLLLDGLYLRMQQA